MMRYITVLFLPIFFILACSKTEVGPEIIVEPPYPIEIRIDSIQEGTSYNISIGDPAAKVYADIQLLAEGMEQKPYLAITGFLNSSVEDLKGRIPLYGTLIFDRKPSSPEGGQIYFEGNSIKSIYSRDGAKLTNWPRSSPDALRLGDSLSDIYGKLIRIRDDRRFASLFNYIGMFEKNVETAYDPVQEESDLWQFNFSIDTKQLMRLDLVFDHGKLTKIRSRYERYE